MNKYTTENQNVFISLHNQDTGHRKITPPSLAYPFMHVKQPLMLQSHTISLLGSLPSSVHRMDTANLDSLHYIFFSLCNVALNLQTHNYYTSSVIIAMTRNCFYYLSFMGEHKKR